MTQHGRIFALQIQGPYLNLRTSGGEIQVKYHPDYEQLKVNDWVMVDNKGQLKKVATSQREPLTGLVSIHILQEWNRYLSEVRHFFEGKGFLELHTPTLVACPGTEPTLEAFVTELKQGSDKQKVFLPTSPELHLKKALTMGYEKIFEIAKCYRNNEVTPLHQPEFWMLEWYRSFAGLLDLQVDVVRFVMRLCDVFRVTRPGLQCYTVRQLFKKYLNFELKPQTSFEEFRDLAIQNQLQINDRFSIDDLFFLLMIEKIEPQLPKNDLVFVEKYPPFQAALARKDHEGWAERFEVYWQGMELANAFDELTDPVEQRARSQEDLKKREGRAAIGLDEEFFQALESGMPPSAGIALGLERLFMALKGIRNIEELRLFPVKTYRQP